MSPRGMITTVTPCMAMKGLIDPLPEATGEHVFCMCNYTHASFGTHNQNDDGACNNAGVTLLRSLLSPLRTDRQKR